VLDGLVAAGHEAAHVPVHAVVVVEETVADPQHRLGRPARSGRSSPIELLHCHRDFMLRLDQAVLQQQGQLQGAGARLAQLRATLLARETRVAAVRKLIERRAQEQRLAAARLEQRRSDDAVPQGLWRMGTDALPAIR